MRIKKITAIIIIVSLISIFYIVASARGDTTEGENVNATPNSNALVDKDNSFQMVEASETKITSIALINGKKEDKIDNKKKVKLLDVVEYKNLPVNERYIVNVKVVNKNTNKVFTDKKGALLEKEKTFKVCATSGKINISIENIEVDLKDLDEDLHLVFFESIYKTSIKTPIVVHEDLNDSNSTIIIKKSAQLIGKTDKVKTKKKAQKLNNSIKKKKKLKTKKVLNKKTPKITKKYVVLIFVIFLIIIGVFIFIIWRYRLEKYYNSKI